MATPGQILATIIKMAKAAKVKGDDQRTNALLNLSVKDFMLIADGNTTIEAAIKARMDIANKIAAVVIANEEEVVEPKVVKRTKAQIAATTEQPNDSLPGEFIVHKQRR